MGSTSTVLAGRPAVFESLVVCSCGQGLDACSTEHCPRCGCTLR